MSTEIQPPKVVAAMSAVMKALAKEGISKNRKSQMANGASYNFRGIDDIYNVLCQLVADAGLVMIPHYTERTVTERETKNGSALFYVTVKGQIEFVAVADGSSKFADVFGEAMDSGDKATNKAMSAAYKYACLQAFCIPTEGDNDADASTHEVAGKSRSTATPHTNAGQSADQSKAQPITEATKKALAALRATEDGERASVTLLQYWKLVDFDQCSEEEGKKAVKWITDQLAAAKKSATKSAA